MHYASMPTSQLKALQSNYMQRMDEMPLAPRLPGGGPRVFGMSRSGSIAVQTAPSMLSLAMRSINAELVKRGEF